MKKRFALLMALLFLAGPSLFAQDEPLPRGLSEAERLWLANRKPVYHAPPASGITTPPGLPVRAMAEWEETQAIVVTWTSFKPILAQIIKAAREQCKVVVVCSNIATCQNELSGYGVDWSSNVDFLVAPFNSIWIRDYGPNPIYLNDVDSLALVDWIYNRPRPRDDTIPNVVGRHLNLPVFSTTLAPYDLVHPGGNNFSDGLAANFSSKLVLTENGPGNTYGTSKHSEAGVDSIMRLFHGIESYVKFDVLPYDGIHHIDMHMKQLNEETLLVGEYPPGVPDRDQIEANIQYLLSTFTTPFGTPYKVVRIPMPPDGGAYPSGGAPLRTYVNSLIVNKTVLLPLYEEKYDTTALRIWKEAMPGYNITGINCNSIIPSGGAIHCITKEIGAAEPLLIQHKQLEDILAANPPAYEVNAFIRHKSGIAAASVFYKTAVGGPYLELPMALTSPSENRWTAAIPQQPEGATVYYYIHATAHSGKQAARPMPAPEGYFRFKIHISTGTSDVEANVARLGNAFPNPAGAITCVPVFSANGGAAALELYDCLGRPVETIFSGTLPAGESRHFFRADQLTPGVYFVILQTASDVFVQKILVQKK